MSSKNVHILAAVCSVCLSFIALLAQGQSFSAQTENSFQIRFLKDSIEVEESSFAFNNVTIQYTGTRKADVEVKAVQPSFINVISSFGQYISLSQNEQQIIPIRFNSVGNVTSAQWHPFTLQFILKQTGQTIERSFWIKQKPFTKWKCALQQPTILYKNGERKADFFLRVENTGSTDNEFTVNYDSELDVEIEKKDRRFVLKSGNSTLIKITASLNFQQAKSFKDGAINLYIANNNGEKRLLVQKVVRIGSSFDEGVYKWNRMPLHLEVTAQNLGTTSAFYSAGLNGTLNMHNRKSIAVQMQTNNFSGGMNAANNVYLVEYNTASWRLTAGSFVDFNHFLINGNGASVRHIAAPENYTEIAFIKGRQEQTRQLDFKVAKKVSEQLSFINNSFINIDDERKTNSYLSINKLKYVTGRTIFGIEAGAGLERTALKSKDTTTTGPMLGYQFESAYKKWSVTSQINFYSQNFPGLNKGFQYHNHELRRQLGKFFIGGFYQANRKVFTTPQDSIFRLLFNTNEKEFGLRSSFVNKKFSLNMSAGLLLQQQDSANALASRMMKLTVNTNWMLNKNWSLSLFSNLGCVRINELPALAPFIAFTNSGSIQWKDVGLQLRYDDGPFYYFEIKEYAKEKLKYKRMQVSPFLQTQFVKANTFLHLQLNYSYEQPVNYTYLLMNTQVTHTFPRLGMTAGALSTIDVKGTREPVINLTLRKTILAPVFRNKESYSFNVILFKDLNGNGAMDEDEPLIKNAMVSANGHWLSTDEAGQVQIKNTPKKELTFDFSKINNLAGWIPKGGLVQVLKATSKEKKFFIPFKVSKLVTGQLILKADEKSNLTMQVSNIRVTATDGNGTEYNTLTDADGSFTLSLPVGRYLISLNEHVFDENFKPVEFSKEADLLLNDKIELSFPIIQKRRMINIKKAE